MFGDNLHNRVKKFRGIRQLLEGFSCRACRKIEKTKLALPISTKPRRRKTPTPQSSDALEIFSLHEFPELPPFLKEHHANLLAAPAQALPAWSSAYDRVNLPVMVRLRACFPHRKLGRADVLGLYQQWQDPVLCLIATMVWGGIKPEHLDDLLAMGEPVLESMMRRLLPLVRSGAWERAFEECSTGGRGKFHGVGYAYFTKIFFFMGHITPVLNPAPIILDKWSASALLVLGREISPEYPWDDLFDLAPLSQGDPALLKAHRVDAQFYRLYVAWFNHWAGLLGITAEALERYVFGMSRKTNGRGLLSNPRNAIVALGRTLFS
jgi:hypothetical protein